MDLHSFLKTARDFDDNATLLPHAQGFRTALADTILVPVYDTDEAWAADFSDACRPPSEPATQPYARATRAALAEWLAANPHVKVNVPRTKP